MIKYPDKSNEEKYSQRHLEGPEQVKKVDKHGQRTGQVMKGGEGEGESERRRQREYGQRRPRRMTEREHLAENNKTIRK